MEHAGRGVLLPARRCSSVPRNLEGSRSSPSSFYAFPSTLNDILFGPRQRLTKYADGMQALPYASSAPTIEEAEVAAAGPRADARVEDAAAAAATEAVKSRSREATEKQAAKEEVVTVAPAEQEAADKPLEEDFAAAVVVAPAETESAATAQIGADAPDDAAAPTAADEAESTAKEEEGGKTDASLDYVADEAPSRSFAVVTADEAEKDTATKDDAAAAPAAEVVSSAGRADGKTVPEAAAAEQEEGCETAEEAQRSSDAATRVGAEERETAAVPQNYGRDEATAVAAEPSAAPEDEPPAEPPQLRTTCEMVAFDAAHIAAWMMEYRHETAHVPPGVQRFVHEFNERAAKFTPLRMGGTSPTPSAIGAAAKKGKKGSLSLSSVGSSKTGIGALADLPSRDGGGFGSSAALRTGTSVAAKKSNALEALGDVWEGRQEAPISLAQGSLRRRGLFGEVEKKKIHHMVVAVLNKVTTDPVKFREVKNELLRLPIPEANAEQMTKIVDAFFTKAVREQHFSHSYADLIAALCKVPQGQHIVGDKTQSLEYRLRMALLKRCQAEFLQSIRAEETDASSPTTMSTAADDVSSPLTSAIEGAQAIGGETEKERRDRMCGNVRFVCELFLRDIVAASVISVIFRICCLGSEFGEFAVPPSYTPTESQVDEIITVVKTAKKRYFVHSAEGRRMLPQLLSQLEYWVKHYAISRCRFVLMSTVDDLRAMLPKEPASPMMSGTPSVAAFVTPQLTHISPTQSPPPCDVSEQGVVSAVSPAPLSVTAALPVVTAADASGQLSMSSTMVGGQPLPAPRSKQVGSVSLSDSAGSINGMAATESPVTGAITRPTVTLTSRSTLQHVRPEAIAKLMAAFSSGQCSADEVAAQLFDTYGNVLPALGAWMDRCLSVVKEEKTRKQTGAVLVACVEQLTAHTNASSEEAAETVAMCREQLHEAAMEALQRAIEGKLYEDLHVFQFWAQLVLSDHARVVYDEELLNEGLELLVYTAPPAVRSYLVEVGKYMTHVLVAPEKLPWQASTEAQCFVRYRPLLVLHSLVMSGGPSEAQALLDNIVGFSDVRQQSLELRLYHAFRTGSPSREVIFEQLRTSPRTTSRDSTLAAEVLSALLIAELCSNGDALVEDSMDLLQITVDGVARAEREIAVVTEVYEILRYTPRPMTMSAAARVLRKFVCMHIVSDETMERADRFYEAERDGAIEKPTQEGGHALAAPPSAEYPRIMDRRGTDDILLSGSISMRSVNGAVATNSNGNGNNGGGVGGGTGSVDGLQSSNASSFGEFRPRDSHPPRRDADSEHTSSRHSERQLSPRRSNQSNGSFQTARGDGGSSKRLYRNSYKNRRRSQGEGGNERHSRAGGSKDESLQQQPTGSLSTSSNYASSHDGSRHGGGGRYDRQHGGSRSGRGSGHFDRGRGGSGGSRGNGTALHRGGGGGGNGRGILREDSRRGTGGGGGKAE
ncbi:eIF4G2 / Eukaryotic translation initiation factor 4 gamma type 2 [Leishmania donovani]|uniref:Eukaryotic_translation_initiation_factor_4_gamma_ type_2_putative/GeneDB:LmjF.15.1320 n=1 Tax=Leishmania donovani TaxID=5661 RepID=A0A6J8F6W4_LEIDO|nr:eIF4G2 / Eukaryotic translation initiation factor 4 gamma type 2 [Leishmania donovani]VDZ43445.1 Eukaryotic_translation_initiation_factor_4_gamma_type_2_putative/GeneDB:LmjF.15.1320 [Leishmania donovani]